MKISKFVKSGTPLGIVIGIGATLAASKLIPALPAIARAARPTARAALKSSLLFVEKGREFLAEAGEEIEDILAEAKAELQSEKAEWQSESSGEINAGAPQEDV